MGFLSSIGDAVGSVGGFVSNPMVASGVLGGLGGYLGQQSANEANRDLAKDQMRFQERMSSTAYERAMADMRKSGLNPILAGKLGGASTPGGAMPIMHSSAGAGINSATNMMKTVADAELKDAQEASVRAETILKQNLIPGSDGLETLGKGFRDLVTDSDGKIRKNIGEAGEALQEWWKAFKVKAESIGISGKRLMENVLQGIDEMSAEELKNSIKWEW